MAENTEAEPTVLTKRQVTTRFFWHQLWVCLGLAIVLFFIPSTLLSVTDETNGFGVSLLIIGFWAELTALRWLVGDWIKMRLYDRILKEFDNNPGTNAVNLKDPETTHVATKKESEGS